MTTGWKKSGPLSSELYVIGSLTLHTPLGIYYHDKLSIYMVFMRREPKGCRVAVHPECIKQLPSLNRVAGQLEGVKRMIEEQRYCPEILAQLRAVRAAANTIEDDILATHIDSCVALAMESGDGAEKAGKLVELKELYRRFNN